MLLVSIHDVSPAGAQPIARLWNICVEHGVVPALLVVPNWHGGWPLESHPEFVRWIRARRDEGAEIVLHGERHDEVGLRRRPIDHWRAWGKTDREAEFLTLDFAAARDRLHRGLDRLRQLDLDPLGFVPPAWLARESTHQAVASVGLSFSEDDRSVRLHRSEMRLRSPVVRWSARTAARTWGSVAVAATRARFQSGAQLPRIALHPDDLGRPAIQRSISRALEHWLTRHAPGRYADLQPRVAA
ncbi:MAG TPA: polysaccharide deacetylase family protein [Gemmatimonadales bacterium]|nr:polysaccharide deacetylase family protein [Gemmatimonadales bacterium]